MISFKMVGGFTDFVSWVRGFSGFRVHGGAVEVALSGVESGGSPELLEVITKARELVVCDGMIDTSAS